jgi:hypothetical protein
MRKIILALLITIMAATFAAADTIYLRNGQAVRGTVLGFINGRFAVKLTAPISINTQNGSQSSGATARATNEIGDVVFIRPRDIERVEIEGRSIDEARYLTRSVQVELGPNWVDTGIDLRRGERVQVNASGVIVAGRTRITPGGLRSTDPNAPLPRAAEGVLIGAIGNDPNAPIIEIGLNREFVADRDGRLYLTANRSNYSDARGAFTAQIRREVNFNQGVAGNRRTDNTNDDNNDPNDLFGTGSSSNESAPVRPRVSGNYPSSGGNPTNTSTGRAPVEKTIDVPGNSRGTDTGIDLRSGDSVTITATGSVTAGRRAGVVSPDGGRVGFGGIAGTYPVAGAGVGALIGYIRLANGQITQPFVVGSQQAITSPVDGRLFLLINDDNYSDNSGSFSVRLNYTPSNTSSTTYPSNSSGTSEKIVNVYANSSGVDTGIDLRQEDNVTISATGSIYSRGTAAISAEGDHRYDSNAGSIPAPDAAFGSLVGYIRMSDGRSTAPFLIGSQRTLTAPADGRLMLMVNDDNYRDNSGSFRVRIVY